jgi:hypothetical protein
VAGRSKSELTQDERRLIAYALCAMVESAPPDGQAQIQIDASVVAAKLGIVRELSQAISMQQAAEAQRDN